MDIFDKSGRWFIILLAFILFGFGIKLSFLDGIKAASATYAAGGFCLIFAFLARFKKFEGFGLKAELWEDKMEEADKLINNLKSLSISVAKPLFTITAKMGRYTAYISRKDRHEMGKQIEESLRQNNVPNEVVEEAKKDWHLYNLIDQARPILLHIRKSILGKQNHISIKISKYKQPIKANDPDWLRLIDKQKEVGELVERINKVFALKTIDEVMSGIDGIFQDKKIIPDSERDKFLMSWIGGL